MLFLTFSFFLSSFPLSLSEPDNEYRDCQPSPCGAVGNISYPFWSEESHRPPNCGILEFQLHCPQDERQCPSIQIDSQTFNVTQIDISNHKMTLTRTDFVYDNCSSHLTDTSVSTRLNLFHYDDSSVRNVTLFYNCSSDYLIEGFNFRCRPGTGPNSDSINYAFYSDDVLHQRRFPDPVNNCTIHIQVPVSKQNGVLPPNDLPDLLDDLGKGFHVQYNTDGSSARGFGIRNQVIVGGVSAVVVSGVIGLLLLCKIKSWRRRIGLDETSKVDQNIEAFIRNHGALALTRYKFADVKKMTNSFKDKLGQGGYGSVYKGKLLNGHLVAVKLLKASKENGEDFINEVASISKTSHVNVVTLFGFCFEGKHKALVYEFMPNGSLDKFIHNEANKKSLHLTWEKLCQIAIGIARGLEYLHRGCNTQILHFDIKPHNILLDESLS